MARIIWWNTQHLSAGSSASKVDAALHKTDMFACDLRVFCELIQTQEYDLIKPINLNYRKKTDQQLCYGVIEGKTAWPAGTAYEPTATDAYRERRYKGGNTFSKLVDRKVLDLGTKDGVHLYALHAPASSKSRKALSFICSSLLVADPTAKWILLGDLNYEPGDLKDEWLTNMGYATMANMWVWSNLSKSIYAPGRATHRSGSTLDYAIAFNVKPEIYMPIDLKPYSQVSDHLPIIIEY